MDNYFLERDFKNQKKTAEILADSLPEFAREFFTGIENRTSPLTRLNYAHDLKLFFEYLVIDQTPLHGLNVKDITLTDLNLLQTTDIENFISYVGFYYKTDNTGKNVIVKNSDKGKARKLASVRAFFKYFFKKGKISANIAANVDTPKIHDKEIIRLEPDEVKILLDTIETGENLTKRQKNIQSHKTAKRDLAMLTLLLGTGIRISECIGLNNDDINLEDNSFVVTRKGGSRTILYFSEEVKVALQAYLDEKQNDKELAFLSPLFLSLQKKRMSVRAAEKLVEKYCRPVSPLKHLTPHKMRSTYGTELYRETGDIYIVADVLGHRDVNTTKKHYAAISEDQRRKASTKVFLRDTTDDKEQ